ncbi:ImmA/IrrE family metallo-endopeptidase [Bacillus cereus]|uniref:ImmA/IrrE family metallo-endopeptidase n=1 Tax=Bacillus cereus TaxID=1396 RepID=UPI0018F2FDBE|nr:ImmA/IrrE family metallo-endopeptidase [Bacillus cereus]MBJ8055262.1 ImmA/IrrE family metallo-endopeptidase [Bacillus cereus]
MCRWIDLKIQHLITKYGTADPFELACALNITIVPSYSAKIFGLFTTYKRVKMIHIYDELSEEMKRFICAHELGHAILHPEVNTPFMRENTLLSTEKIEVQANYFATKLLLSEQDFSKYQTKAQVLMTCGIPPEMQRFLK